MQKYSQQIKDKVRLLRTVDGLSLGQINAVTTVPKTTLHLWLKDVALSTEQKEKIKGEALQRLQKGRIRMQRIHKEKRLEIKTRLTDKGKNEIGKLNSRELFIAGVALYWAEGFKNKHEHRLGFCNSDPDMIKFYLYWLDKCLSIKKKDLVARLTVNESYKDESEKIEAYWSKLTGIPLDQFTKPFYQRTQWKKEYTDTEYYGVLRIHVKSSLAKLFEMRGWIEGLKIAMPG